LESILGSHFCKTGTQKAYRYYYFHFSAEIHINVINQSKKIHFPQLSFFPAMFFAMFGDEDVKYGILFINRDKYYLTFGITQKTIPKLVFTMITDSVLSCQQSGSRGHSFCHSIVVARRGRSSRLQNK